MLKFNQLFKSVKCPVIGMIHVKALPGTPKYGGNFDEIVQHAIDEAKIYKESNIDSVMLENMHDIPYVKEIRPEIVSSMTRLALEIRKILPSKPIGNQVLTCGHKEALSVAKAANLQFIRAEGFVFGHVGDEGYIDACAGDLLRYRKQIDAEKIMIFTDIKKKHSSHAITQDVSLLETAKAAEFFLSDGLILTGTATGSPTSLGDVKEVFGKTKLPILIGSGINLENLANYFHKVNGLIVGSYFKENGQWDDPLSSKILNEFMAKICSLRNK